MKVRAFYCLLAAGAVLTSMGCSRGTRPVVKDFDSYYDVTLGSAHYLTPDPITLVDQGRGYVVHGHEALPGTEIVVRLNEEAPRSFRLDGDFEQRRFLRSLRGARQESVQVREIDGRRNLTVRAQGYVKGKATHGTMTMIRENGRTAIVTVVGPQEFMTEINMLSDQVTDSITL